MGSEKPWHLAVKQFRPTESRSHLIPQSSKNRLSSEQPRRRQNWMSLRNWRPRWRIIKRIREWDNRVRGLHSHRAVSHLYSIKKTHALIYKFSFRSVNKNQKLKSRQARRQMLWGRIPIWESMLPSNPTVQTRTRTTDSLTMTRVSEVLTPTMMQLKSHPWSVETLLT